MSDDDKIKKVCTIIKNVCRFIVAYEVVLNISYMNDTGKYMFDDNGKPTEDYILYSEKYFDKFKQ